ncbi:hypothetical protein [Acinetobacter baumannii]|uniref:hypothetical protein n=1 Tax=Acinetobacter baumannii TaxID=470 RepID=UPI00068D0002|nr:hypothetical protein [Acinetobacter baumannii]
MTEFQKITHEIRQLQIELNHLGSCNTKGLNTEQIAHLDERFFLAIAKQNKLIAQLNNRAKNSPSCCTTSLTTITLCAQ